jgi:hypothetical protein
VGGDDVSLVRQGEADRIIDLVLGLEGLTASTVKCVTCKTDHGSDH